MLKKVAIGTCGLFIIAIALTGLSGVGAQVADAAQPGQMHKMKMGDNSNSAGPTEAVCVLFETGPGDEHEVCGTVHFKKMSNGKIHVTGKITGLSKGKHGFHVHTYGDLTSMKDGKSTGGHFDPHHMKHGRPGDKERHVGDLGNVTANDKGVAMIDITDSVISFDGENSIIGRGIVVHKGEDKFTQPTGDADGRYAVGVIGVAK